MGRGPSAFTVSCVSGTKSIFYVYTEKWTWAEKCLLRHTIPQIHKKQSLHGEQRPRYWLKPLPEVKLLPWGPPGTGAPPDANAPRLHPGLREDTPRPTLHAVPGGPLPNRPFRRSPCPTLHGGHIARLEPGDVWGKVCCPETSGKG